MDDEWCHLLCNAMMCMKQRGPLSEHQWPKIERKTVDEELDDYCKHSFKAKDNDNRLHCKKNGLTRQWTNDKAIGLNLIS